MYTVFHLRIFLFSYSFLLVGSTDVQVYTHVIDGPYHLLQPLPLHVVYFRFCKF
jgi:hypothetical protein